MTWPFDYWLELLRVRREDRAFPAADPDVAVVVDRLMGLRGISMPDALSLKALEIAVGEIGKGDGRDPITGAHTNNVGPDVRRYCSPSKDGQPWCAAFAGWCWERAAIALEAALPFKRSLGAKKLGANLAECGRRFTDYNQARPGDLVIWHRGVGVSALGHVGIVKAIGRGLVVSVDGNSGPLVREVSRPLERLSFFASLRER